MTPTYLSQFSSFHPGEEEAQDQGHLYVGTDPSANTSSLVCSSFLGIQQQLHELNDTHDHHHYHHQELQQQKQQQPNEFTPIGGGSNQTETFTERSFCDPLHGGEHSHGSATWKSSKIRLMRRMIGSDQAIMSNKPRRRRTQVVQEHPNQDTNVKDHDSGIIRVCSDCNTTKTPLWRSGPRGPKSLCNACGIRQRKARRAMAAAAAVSAGMIRADAPTKRKTEKKADGHLHVLPYKKRCNMITTGNKLSVDEGPVKVTSNSAFRPVFPQDEKDAAILLMALSCGLISS